MPAAASFRPILRRRFSCADYDKILAYLSDVDWFASFQTCSTVNDMYEMFAFILRHSIELFVPVIECTESRKYLPSYLSNLDKICARAWDKAVVSQSETDWNNYEALRNRFCRKLGKYNFAVEKRVINSGEKSAFYKMISIRLKSYDGVRTLRNDSGVMAYSDHAKVEMLADYFKSVCADNGTSNPGMVNISKFPLMTECPWFLEYELSEIIRKWPPSYSLTPDEVPLYFIKRVSEVIMGPLKYIMNLSLIRAEIPNKWKHSYVTPLPKRPPYDSPNNYRPISITSIFARLAENIIKRKYLEKLSRGSIWKSMILLMKISMGLLRGNQVKPNS